MFRTNFVNIYGVCKNNSLFNGESEMTRAKYFLAIAYVLFAAMTIMAEEKSKEEGFVRLFPKDGTPESWLVRL